MGYLKQSNERLSFNNPTSMSTKGHAQDSDRAQLIEQLAQVIWMRLALVLVPASNALRCQRPELARLMNRVLDEVKGDIAAHVLKYDVVLRRNAP